VTYLPFGGFVVNLTSTKVRRASHPLIHNFRSYLYAPWGKVLNDEERNKRELQVMLYPGGELNCKVIDERGQPMPG